MNNPNPEAWLNGWTRSGNIVLLGTGVHCAGCGRDFGTATVFIAPDWTPPAHEPDYPFERDTCPVCHEKAVDYWTVETLSKLPLSLLRRAIALRKEQRDP